MGARPFLPHQLPLQAGDGRDARDGRERSPYTRFIPAEELGSLSVFAPGMLGQAFDAAVPAAATAPARPWQALDLGLPDLAATAAAPTAPPAAAASPATGAAPAHAPSRTELRAELLAELRAELSAELMAELQSSQAESQQAEVQAARQSGYQDGYRDGLEALDSFKTSYAQQVTAQVGQVLTSLDGELRALEQRIAGSVSKVAVSLARHVLRQELQQRPETVVRVAQEAVAALLVDARQLTIRVHPDDQALVAQGCADLLAARGGHVLADPSLARGGCRVDTDAGGVDATVATRWAAALRTLGDDTPWQPRGERQA